MSRDVDVDAQLGRLFQELPGPSPETSERALHLALEALPEPAGSHRRALGTLLLLAAAALTLLAIAAGALAAAGSLHVSLGKHAGRERQAVSPTARKLAVPHGAQGVAAIVGGRLWLTTRSGLRIEGLPVASAALSPHALYVAAGIGAALVAMAPDGHRAWSQPTGGPVVAIDWAPNGLQIAYVVRLRHGFQLRLIEGNGRKDRLLDGAVRPARPSWRADSLALAYVGAGGRPLVYDLGHRSRRLVDGSSMQEATRLAYAPHGGALAVATAHGFAVVDAGGRANGFDVAPARVAGLGWLHGELALAVDPAFPGGGHGPYVQLFRLGAGGEAVPEGQFVAPGPVSAFEASGGRLALAVDGERGGRRLLLASSAGSTTRRRPLPHPQLLLTIPAGAGIRDLAVR